MKFTVIMLLTCILYCAQGQLPLELFASTVGRFLSQMSRFVLARFSSGDAEALLRESYTFV